MIQSLIQAEGLPNVAALLRGGASGQLLAAPPCIEPALWTSLITGKRAHKHGLLHAQRPLGTAALGTCLAGRESVCTATLGAILSASGLSVHQVGWPVSHPVEKLRGVTVSDRFATEGQTASIGSRGGWPWVQPASAALHLFERRCVPAEVEEISLAQLLPAGMFTQPLLGRLQNSLREVLAESLTLFRATKWCAETTQWDCIVCAFPSLLRCQEVLSKVLPDSEFAQERRRILAGCHEHLDMLLGQLVACAGDDATVILTSVGTADFSQPLLNIKSPAIRSGSLPPRASVLDVTPTVLTLLGISVGQDMDGTAWTSLIDAKVSPVPITPEQIETWDIYIHAPKDAQDQTSDTPDANRGEAVVDEAVRHLVELGYEDPLESAAREQADKCRGETERNRALSQLDGGQCDEAIELLKNLKSSHPDWIFPYELLADTYTHLKEYDLANQELEFLIHHGVESARLYFTLGRIALARREIDVALKHFHVAGRIAGRLRGLDLAKGIALLKRREYSEAKEVLLSALEIDGSTAPILDSLATCDLGLKQYEKAAEFALAALEQDMRCSQAHYHLAIALVHLDRLAEAKQAFETSSSVDPEFLAPIRWLARLSSNYLAEPEQAKEYLRRGRKIILSRRSDSAHQDDSTLTT